MQGEREARPVGSRADDRDRELCRLETNTEHLVEFDRCETLPNASVRATVDDICADAGASVDWTNWTVGAPIPKQVAMAAEPLVFPVAPWRLDQPAQLEPEAALPP